MVLDYNGKGPQIAENCFIAPNCTLIGDVRIGPGSSVWFGAVARADNREISIGCNSNIQDNCVLHNEPTHPLHIGDGVTVGHSAVLHGCTIGDGTLIGMHSTILDGAEIGKNCIVGAGALVTAGKSFPDGSLILGAPAKAVRQLTEAEIAANRASAAWYVDRAEKYLSHIRGISE